MLFKFMLFQNAFVGFILGDVLGLPVEFKTREELKVNRVTDFLEYGTYNQPKGTWSDDTSMTIATLQSLIDKKGLDYEDIMNKFIEWYKQGKYTPNGKCFDIGDTTKRALEEYYLIKTNPVECGRKEECNSGNGSLMRMLPIAFYCIDKTLDDDEIYNIVNKVSCLTHRSDKCIFSCYLYTIFLKEVLKGRLDKNKKIIYDSFKEYINKTHSNYNIEFDRILKKDITQLTEEEIKSTGYVIDTLEAAIWCFLTTNNCKQAILKAVNLGGDTDTIGAITGSIAGAYYQEQDLVDNEFIQVIKWKELLFDICYKFENYLYDIEV